MAKNFNNITMDTLLTNADKILVGQSDGDDVGLTIGEVKRFTKQPLDANFRNGIIIPFYIYPTDNYNDTNIATIVELKKANRDIPMIVIINPSSGPGSVTDGNYTAIINYLQAYGIHVIGYTTTNYRGQTTAQVEADIDGWKTYYPKVSGILFDQQSDGTTDLAAEQAYYKEVAQYSRKAGFDITVSNPGKNVDNTWYDLFDVLVEVENSTYPDAAAMRGPWPYCKQLFKRGAIIHTAGYTQADADLLVKNYGWVYITSDTAPNPYDTLSTVLNDLVNSIRA